MKKRPLNHPRGKAEPVSARRKSDRSRPDEIERPPRHRPRRHDDPFANPDRDEQKRPRHGPTRHDRRSSRNQLRSWEGEGWDDGSEDELEDD